MKIRNRNLWIGIITIFLCLSMTSCSFEMKNTESNEESVKDNTDISKSNTSTRTKKADSSTKKTNANTKKSDTSTKKSSTSKKKSKTSSDVRIVNENNDEGLAVKTVMLFSEYENTTPYNTGEMCGVYIEQFNIDLKDTTAYRNYLKKRGYTLDTSNTRENSYLFRGNTELENDSIIIEKDGNFVDFAYGQSVRLDGINMTVSDWVSGNTISGNTTGGYGQLYEYNMPSTRQTSQCPICHGTGMVICKGCNGLGYIPSINYSADYGAGSSVYESKNHCYSCNGKGQSMCTHCGGTGMI